MLFLKEANKHVLYILLYTVTNIFSSPFYIENVKLLKPNVIPVRRDTK